LGGLLADQGGVLNHKPPKAPNGLRGAWPPRPPWHPQRIALEQVCGQRRGSSALGRAAGGRDQCQPATVAISIAALTSGGSGASSTRWSGYCSISVLHHVLHTPPCRRLGALAPPPTLEPDSKCAALQHLRPTLRVLCLVVLKRMGQWITGASGSTGAGMHSI
jgi:hypothetical protein